MALKYTGEGRLHLKQVPMRDLTDEEVEECFLSEADLIKSGIYAKVKKGKGGGNEKVTEPDTCSCE